MYESFVLEKDEDAMMDVPVELPEVNFFVSAPYVPTDGEEPVELPEEELVELPEEEVPQITEPEPEPIAVPVEVQTVVSRNEPHSEPIPAPTEPEEVKVVPVNQQAVPTEQVELSHKEPEERSEVLEISALPGEEVEIVLDNEGWIFNSDSSDSGVNLRKREFLEGKTLFRFLPDEEGAFTLIFILQNPESGDEESLVYKLISEMEGEEALLPVVINPSDEEMDSVQSAEVDDGFELLLEEENVPGLVASIDHLVDESADPGSDILMDAFDLLESQGGYDGYLVELAENSFNLYPYDNLSAEMLYRAAQAVEKPGNGQDIEKAVGLFKLVRDYFPLSMYSDKSEERIRYLERHFMKIY